MPRKNNTEEQLHLAVCRYIKVTYPTVIFTSEPSGLYVSKHRASILKAMRSHSGLPDLWILAPRGDYHGLFIELKTEKNTPFLKNDTLSKNTHVQKQALVLKRLLMEGYYANFAAGFDHAIAQIDAYMSGLDMTPYYTPQ